MPAIDVTVAAEFTVPFASSAATGYQWQLDAAPDGVELLGSETVVPRGAQPGDAGTQVFRLRAARVGTFTLTFVLKRRWEAAAIETHQVEIRAH